MTTTITKRADELKPGDVWVVGRCRHSVLAVISAGSRIEMTYCSLPIANQEAGLRERCAYDNNSCFDIESPVAPAMTPAQQHAEELLRLVRSMAGVLKYKHTMSDHDFDEHSKAHIADTHEILAKIAPPQPPTLEEALAMLQTVMEQQNNTPEAVALLDRARRSGKLK